MRRRPEPPRFAIRGHTVNSRAHSFSQPPKPIGSFAEPQARRSPSSSSARRSAPPVARSRRLPATNRYPNRARATPSYSPATPRPRPPTRSPEFWPPQRQAAPGTALQGPRWFQGLLRKLRAYLWTSKSFRRPNRKKILYPFVCFGWGL
jgi:hypothetical protein